MRELYNRKTTIRRTITIRGHLNTDGLSVTMWDRQGSQYVRRLKSLGNEETVPRKGGTSGHPRWSPGCECVEKH